MFPHYSPNSPKLEAMAASLSPSVSLFIAVALQVPRKHALCHMGHGVALTPEDVGYLPARVPCNGYLRVRRKKGGVSQSRPGDAFP